MHEEEINEEHESKDSLLKEAASQELIALLESGKNLKTEIEESSTRTKKSYLQKKLDKINTQAIQMIVAMETLDDIEQRKAESDVDIDEEAIQKSLDGVSQ